MVSSTPQLPPGFRLHAIGQTTRSVQIRLTAHKAAESIRPVCVSEKSAQHRPTEELPAGPDLRRDRKLAQPSFQVNFAVLCRNKPVGVIKSSLKRERDVFGEKDLGSGTKGDPLVPVVLRVTVLASLIDEDGHDGELLVRLKKHLLNGYKPF